MILEPRIGELQSARILLCSAVDPLAGDNQLARSPFDPVPLIAVFLRRDRTALEEREGNRGRVSDDEVLGVAVIGAGDRPRAPSILESCRRALIQHGTTFTFFVSPASPPEHSHREDGPVQSFLMSAALCRASLARRPYTASQWCYEAADLVLTEPFIVDRLCATDGSPHTAPIDEPSSVQLENGGATTIIPHRGSLALLDSCLAYARRQLSAPDVVQVCFDETPTGAHAELLRRHAGVAAFFTEPAGVGPYVGRQHLASRARTPCVLFQDSDDASCHDRLVVLRRELAAHRCDMVGSHELRVDTFSRTVRTIRYPLDVSATLDVAGAHALLHPTSLVRTRAFVDSGGFSTCRSLGSDSQFLLRAHFTMRRIRNANAFLYVKREFPGTLTTDVHSGRRSQVRNQLDGAWYGDFERIKSGAMSLSDSSLVAEPAYPAPLVHPLKIALGVGQAASSIPWTTKSRTGNSVSSPH